MILCLLQRPSSDMDGTREADRLPTAEQTREYARVTRLWHAAREQALAAATPEEIRDYERVYGPQYIARERALAVANGEEPRDPEAEWLPISISRTRDQNPMDPVEAELADLRVAAIDFMVDNEYINFLAEDPTEEAQDPTSSPEPTRTCPSPPPVEEPAPRRWIRGRPEPTSPTREEDPGEVHGDPLENRPTTRHARPQTPIEPESADDNVLTWRGIKIGPATASEAKLVVDILAAIRDEVPTEEKEQLMRAVLGLPTSHELKK